MFERFTDKARKVVILAKNKAAERGDDQIRPVHMLYGLVSTDGVAARALTALGVDPAAVEHELGRSAPEGRAPLGKAASGEFAAATLPDLGLDPATARGRVLTEVDLILRGDPPGR